MMNPIALAAFALLLPVTAPRVNAQELRLTTSSAEAQSAFRNGLHAVGNELYDRAALHLERAVALDAKFAIARAFLAAYAPGMPAEQRATELQRAASDAMNASVGELLLILALRAPPGSERTSLLRSVVDAVPGDRHVLLLYTANLESVTERVRGFESLIRRFPEFAPPFRRLGLLKAREQSDPAAALPLMESHLKMQSDNPHAYQGVAEVMVASGRRADAARHYERAIELDPKYVAGYIGLAEVALLDGDAAGARARYDLAFKHERATAARLNIRLAQAATFITENNPRAAMAALTRIANDAEATGFTAVAAQAHRQLAVVEAAFGNKASVDARVRKAESLGNQGSMEQRMFAAAAYALAGDVRGARPLANAVSNAASNSASLIFKREAAGVAALVEASGGNHDRAAALIEQAGIAGALAKAVLAENLKRAGRLVEANALAKEVLATSGTDIFALIARQKAKQI